MIVSWKEDEKLIYDPTGMAFTLELLGEMAAATAAADLGFVPDQHLVQCVREWV